MTPPEQSDSARRDEFRRVMAWLDARGYHVEHGFGADADVVHHQGSTMQQLTCSYGRDRRS